MRVKITVGDAGDGAAARRAAAKPAAKTKLRGRALAHPEVQRFREVFPGGEVRAGAKSEGVDST